jgi:hypothetical protein
MKNENKEPYTMKTQKVMDVNGKIHKTIIKKFVYQ